MKFAIETKNLMKTYIMGDQIINALNGLSLSIRTGEMVSITGASGSGKSTLLNVLGCLDLPDSGSYILDGENVEHMNSNQLANVRNQKIGFVFQTFNLLSSMTSIENVELPLQYSGVRNPRQRAEEVLEKVGLKDRMHHEPSELSGGQRQRVAIARALINNPAIILADEPTGNLDSKTSEEILTLFNELHKEGKTIIMVTHEDEIADRCERRINLKDGQLT
jgi:putative ABC transport system ATP-binding protein